MSNAPASPRAFLHYITIGYGGNYTRLYGAPYQTVGWLFGAFAHFWLPDLMGHPTKLYCGFEDFARFLDLGPILDFLHPIILILEQEGLPVDGI